MQTAVDASLPGFALASIGHSMGAPCADARAFHMEQDGWRAVPARSRSRPAKWHRFTWNVAARANAAHRAACQTHRRPRFNGRDV